MSAELWEYMQTANGQSAIVNGITTALKDIDTDLAGGLLGGTELAFRITAINRHQRVSFSAIAHAHYTSPTPDPEGGKYDYVEIAAEKEEWTLEWGLTTREGIIQAIVGHYKWYGNVIVYLSDDPNFQIVISCSGLSEEGDETYAGLLGYHVKRELLLAFARHNRAA